MAFDPIDLIREARKAGRRALSEADGKRLLEAFGVRVPRSVVVSDRAGIVAAVDRLAAPFVLKLMSRDILHKSDAGGVALGLQDAQSVEAAMQRMRSQAGARGARVDGFLVGEMAPPGVGIVACCYDIAETHPPSGVGTRLAGGG
jgi:acyl-CoA synthetase (NDP forming)